MGASVALLAGATALAACGGDDEATGAAEGDGKTVAVALLAPVNVLEANVKSFKDELARLVPGVRYEDYNAQGQISNVSTIVSQIARKRPDLVYAVGTPFNIAVAQKLPTTPQVFGVMTDPVGAKIAESLERPGDSATGTTVAVPAPIVFDVVADALPGAKRLGVIGNEAEQNTVSSIRGLKAEGTKRGVSLDVRSVTKTADAASAIRSLRDVDGLLIPCDNTVVSAMSTVTRTATELRLPTVMPCGGDFARAGVMVAFGADFDYLGREAAKQALEILEGKKPGDIPVLGVGSPGVPNQVYVNEATAKAVGVPLTAELRKRMTKLVGG